MFNVTEWKTICCCCSSRRRTPVDDRNNRSIRDVTLTHTSRSLVVNSGSLELFMVNFRS